MSNQFRTNILTLGDQKISADSTNLYLNDVPISGGDIIVSGQGGNIGTVSGLVISSRHYTLDFLGPTYQTGTVTQNTIFRTINRTAGASVTAILQHVGLSSGWNYAFPSGSASGFTWIGGIQPIGIASGKRGTLCLTCLKTTSKEIMGSYAEQLV